MTLYTESGQWVAQKTGAAFNGSPRYQQISSFHDDMTGYVPDSQPKGYAVFTSKEGQTLTFRDRTCPLI